ncbi:hypothetical protein BDB00DRAFT_816579 [Zychaea mexicana]|uniref:uncharacterized protein n=1 Tax=Zychaea mexicana TaxID=64656 RepID=UPI0022FE50D3|nr:uncharacterized protein BDB00DRAFT_816579 [Zychaea mexicana]KAI9494985.1 hypothetical protein BDB00DRAFT_816579 [Zychaea mexicana]
MLENILSKTNDNHSSQANLLNSQHQQSGSEGINTSAMREEQEQQQQQRSVQFSDAPAPTPPAHDASSPASQSRDNLVPQETSRNMSPMPSPQQQQQQQPYYNGYQSYSAQQPYYNYNNYYPTPPPHQAVPVMMGNGKPEHFWYRRSWPAVWTYLTGAAMLGMLVYELVKNHQVTGNVIEMSPFNIMIGPSSDTLILVGARFVPCMHETTHFPTSGTYQCPNMTDYGQTGATAPTLTPVQTNTTLVGPPCTLQDVCGISTFEDPDVPDQWYRFLTAIFLHSGVIHWLFNMFVHMSLGASMERFMNPIRYAIVWLASGAFGFIFGGVFAPVGNASVGCSGALFGVVALLFIDLFTQWRTTLNPWWEFTKLIFLMLFSFVFGLLPGLDNFAHIGGFVAGLFSGVIFFPIPTATRTSKVCLWVVRLILLGGLVGMFYGMIDVFYSGQDPQEICPWCKYLACLPIADMCEAYYA